MSPAQSALFWRLWVEACEMQGWQGAKKEVERKKVLADLGWTSLKQVDETAGFDRLKGHLLRLAYRLPGGTEAAFPDVGEMRRHCALIRDDLLPRLGAVHPNPGGYLGRILRDRFGGVRHWEVLAENPQDGPRLIRQLLYTLTRAVRRLQKVENSPVHLDKPLKTTAPGGPAGQTGSPPEPVPVSPS